MDKITFDFENNTIEIHTENQDGVLVAPDLKDRKPAILKAGGLVTADLSNIQEILTNYINGYLSAEDFNTLVEKDIEGTYGQ